MNKPARSKARKEMAVSASLREAVRNSGASLYRISKDSGVPYATLHRFVLGGGNLVLESLDKLCAYLGLELTKKKGGLARTRLASCRHGPPTRPCSLTVANGMESLGFC
jgi:hypothetical protein